MEANTDTKIYYNRPAALAVGKTNSAQERDEFCHALNQAIASRSQEARGTGEKDKEEELRQVFYDFVGQTLYGTLLRSMRRTVGKPAYFYGGRAEQIFQQQLDQVLVEKIAHSSAGRFAEPMFELFQLGMSRR